MVPRLLRALHDKDTAERAATSLVAAADDDPAAAREVLKQCLSLPEYKAAPAHARRARLRVAAHVCRTAVYGQSVAPVVAQSLRFAAALLATERDRGAASDLRALVGALAAAVAGHAAKAAAEGSSAGPDGASLLATLLIDPLVRGIAAAVDPDAKALGCRCVAAAVYECAIAVEVYAAPLSLNALAATLAATGDARPNATPPAHGEAASLAALCLSVVGSATPAPDVIVHAVARLATGAVGHRGDYRVREKGAAAARALADHASRHPTVAAALVGNDAGEEVAHALAVSLSAARFDKVRHVREGVQRATDALRHVLGDAVDSALGSPAAARVPLGVAERRRAAAQGGGAESPRVEIYVPGAKAPLDADALPETLPAEASQAMRMMEARVAALARRGRGHTESTTPSRPSPARSPPPQASAERPTFQHANPLFVADERAPHGSVPDIPHQPFGAMPSFEAVDTNRDGVISRAEYESARAGTSKTPKSRGGAGAGDGRDALVARVEESLMELAEAGLFERLETALPGLGAQGRLEPALRQLLRAQVADLASYYRRKCGERIDARVAEYRAAVQKLREELQRDVREIHAATNVAIDAEHAFWAA